GDAALLGAALVLRAQPDAVAVVAVLVGRAGHGRAGVGLAAPGDAQLARRAARGVAVDAGAVLADPRRRAGQVGAQVDALAGGLVAAGVGRAGDARAHHGDAEVVHALEVPRAGDLAGPALDRALPILAPEPRGAGRVHVRHAVAVVVLAVADLGAGEHAAFADEAAHAAADQVAGAALADADLRLRQAGAEALHAGLREDAVVDHAVAVVVLAVADLVLRHAGRAAHDLAVDAGGDAGHAVAERGAARHADPGQRPL